MQKNKCTLFINCLLPEFFLLDALAKTDQTITEQHEPIAEQCTASNVA